MKSVGRIYQQTFIDTYSRVALAKLYTEKTAITAADMLNDKVIPFFDGQGVDLLRILMTVARNIAARSKTTATRSIWQWGASTAQKPKPTIRKPTASTLKGTSASASIAR